MGHKGNCPIRGPCLFEKIRILGIKGLGLAAARIASKKSKGICLDTAGRLPHGRKAFGRGKMAANM